jgi:hypothetical protein
MTGPPPIDALTVTLRPPAIIRDTYERPDGVARKSNYRGLWRQKSDTTQNMLP